MTPECDHKRVQALMTDYGRGPEIGKRCLDCGAVSFDEGTHWGRLDPVTGMFVAEDEEQRVGRPYR